MAKRNRGLTEKAIRKRHREGRGSGEGVDYKPWLTVQDVPSRGQANRVLGCKTKRVHHLMSLNELRYFYLLEWATLVTDVREQFPLWPHEETRDLARKLGVKPPTPPGGGPMVMTSDFRITLVDGGDAVRTVKAADALDDERVLQKLDIEREYWRCRSVDWGIVIAEDIPLQLVKNIEWLHPCFSLGGLELDIEDFPTIASHLTNEVRYGRENLASIACRCDDYFNLAQGTCLALARYLLATRHWETDMTARINPARPLVLREAQEV